MYLGAGLGGVIGGFVPSLFGAGALSMWGILGSLIGGILGIIAIVKLSQWYGI